MAYIFDYKEAAHKREHDIALLINHVKAYGVPKDWNTNIRETSIIIISPDKSHVIKIDASLTLTIDVIRGISKVKSSVFTCKTVAEIWRMAEQALNAFTSKGKTWTALKTSNAKSA